MAIDHVRALLHNAALGTGSWDRALDALAAETGAERGQLIGYGEKYINFSWVSGMPEGDPEEFGLIDGANPEVNFRIAASSNASPFEIRHEEHYADATVNLSSEIYVDYCERYDLPFCCQTIVTQTDSGFVGLATLRTWADGVSNAPQRRSFAKLVPHVRSAVELQTAIEGQGKQLLLGSFDALDKCALLLDRTGRCLGATAATDALLATTGAMQLSERRPVCHDRRDQAALDSLIAAVIMRRTGHGRTIIRQPSGRPLLATVHAFDPPETNIGFRPAAIVVLQHPGAASSDLRNWLATMGLTIAEIAIAQALAEGHARTDIADRRCSTIGTVRQQIKAIYSKLGVHREAELVALLGDGGRH